MRPDRPLSGTVIGSALLLVVLAIPSLLYGAGGGADEDLMIVMLINLVLVLSLQVFAGNTGVLAFGHVVFAAVGGYAAALVAMPVAIKVGVLSQAPFGLGDVEVAVAPAFAIGIVVATLFAAILAVAVCRISGIGAGILSLALLIVVHEVLLNWSELTGGAQGLFGIPGTVTMVGALAAAAVAIVLARIYKDSRAGLRAQVSREDELAAAAMGVSVARSRVSAWLLSAAIGALGGILLTFHLGSVTPNEYYLDLTFVVITFLILGGMQSVTGAVVATMAMTAILEVARYLADGPVIAGIDLPEINGLTQLCLGVTVIVVMIWRPEGLFGDRELDELLPWRWRARQVLVRADPDDAVRPSSVDPDRRPEPGGAAGAALRAEDLEKDFGGLVALRGVSLTVRSGEVVGVIGPNGAGKTTLLNLVSGQIAPTTGTVEFAGQRIDGRNPREIAELGMARTFQNVRLFEGLSVRDNVEIAVMMGAAHGRRRHAVATPDLLSDFDLTHHANKKAGTLAQGDRRRLEMARAVGLNPSLILFDEPTAGMTDGEADTIALRLQAVQRRLGCAIVLVDHNVRFVMEVCDRIHVLKEGREIARGTPGEIAEDPAVTDAYLGSREGTRIEGATAGEPHPSGTE